jgi:hypothetical protein
VRAGGILGGHGSQILEPSSSDSAGKDHQPSGRICETVGFTRDDFYRELRNTQHPDPIARLKAVHHLGIMLQAELAAAIDEAELVNVRSGSELVCPRVPSVVGRDRTRHRRERSVRGQTLRPPALTP